MVVKDDATGYVEVILQVIFKYCHYIVNLNKSLSRNHGYMLSSLSHSSVVDMCHLKTTYICTSRFSLCDN